MFIGLDPWLTKMSELTYAQLANVQTVGVGLYLALAVIQAVSATGVAGLRRRAGTLRSTVVNAKLVAEYTNMRRLSAEIGGLEIGFHRFNSFFLRITIPLFISSVVYFAFCTINQDSKSGVLICAFILFYYLLLPILMFIFSAVIISIRCKFVEKSIKSSERRIIEILYSG